MKTKVTYQCGICEDEFKTPEEAQACEDKGRDKALVAVGDIVFCRSGFGWYSGEPKWVSNLEVRPHAPGTGENACHVQKPRCPKRNGNCFEPCCTFQFYYVVTAIDYVDDFHYDQVGHRIRYHVMTKAMTSVGANRGYSGGFTFNEGHCTPELVAKPPAAIVKDAQDLIGKKASHLL